jgi:hypothetical protein
MPPISRATHSGQAANWVWMATMIAAFRPQHSGMARVAGGRDRRVPSQCAIRPCRQGLDHGPATIAWHLQHYYRLRVLPVSIHRRLRAAGPPSAVWAESRTPVAGSLRFAPLGESKNGSHALCQCRGVVAGHHGVDRGRTPARLATGDRDTVGHQPLGDRLERPSVATLGMVRRVICIGRAGGTPSRSPRARLAAKASWVRWLTAASTRDVGAVEDRRSRR